MNRKSIIQVVLFILIGVAFLSIGGCDSGQDQIVVEENRRLRAENHRLKEEVIQLRRELFDLKEKPILVKRPPYKGIIKRRGGYRGPFKILNDYEVMPLSRYGPLLMDFYLRIVFCRFSLPSRFDGALLAWPLFRSK